MTRPAALISALSLPLALLLALPVDAQTLTLGSGTVRRGDSIDLPLRFDAGATAAVGFDLGVVYDRTRFDAPTCIAHLGAFCAVQHSLGRVNVIVVDVNLRPLTSGVYMTLRMRPAATAPRTTALLGARQITFASATGTEVAGTIHTGQLIVR
jgi:hypothetical protein